MGQLYALLKADLEAFEKGNPVAAVLIFLFPLHSYPILLIWKEKSFPVTLEVQSGAAAFVKFNQ